MISATFCIKRLYMWLKNLDNLCLFFNLNFSFLILVIWNAEFSSCLLSDMVQSHFEDIVWIFVCLARASNYWYNYELLDMALKDASSGLYPTWWWKKIVKIGCLGLSLCMLRGLGYMCVYARAHTHTNREIWLDKVRSLHCGLGF